MNRYFHVLGKSCPVWCGLFLRSLGQALPKPFFLPKPIGECTAKDLEYAFRTWYTGWNPAVPLRPTICPVVAGKLSAHEVDFNAVLTAPGGRWVTMGCRDGSVWCIDLADDSNTFQCRATATSAFVASGSPKTLARAIEFELPSTFTQKNRWDRQWIAIT